MVYQVQAVEPGDPRECSRASGRTFLMANKGGRASQPKVCISLVSSLMGGARNSSDGQSTRDGYITSPSPDGGSKG